MAKGSAFARYILFCVFFAAGAGAITISMLIDPEITRYYRNISQLQRIEYENTRIEKLMTAYDAQIAQIEKDPNMLANLRSIALGDTPVAEGTLEPRASKEQLAKAREALIQDLDSPRNDTPVPPWARRCSEPDNRRVIFIAGCGLILVTFIFFGTPRHYKPRKRNKKQPDA